MVELVVGPMAARPTGKGLADGSPHCAVSYWMVWGGGNCYWWCCVRRRDITKAESMEISFPTLLRAKRASGFVNLKLWPLGGLALQGGELVVRKHVVP
jgi:hypothetical protein